MEKVCGRKLDTAWYGGKKRNRFVIEAELGSSPGMDVYQLNDAGGLLNLPESGFPTLKNRKRQPHVLQRL